MKAGAEKGANVVSEQDQAKAHAPPWAVLAGLDRVLGDPVITGLPEREPRSEKHFGALEPELEWKSFELYYYHTWTECDDEGDCETYTREYRHPVRLLRRADAYEARFEYGWREKVIEEKTEDSYLKIVVPELASVGREGPYYAEIRELLAERGLTRKIDTELVLELAVNMDPEFYYEFGTPADFRMDIAHLEIYNGPMGPVTWPTTGRISSGYGWRTHPILGANRFHTGIDIANSEGTPVCAAANGVVVYATTLSGYGKTVLVNHGEYSTLYAHLRSFGVRPGDEVSAGDVIGEMGQTGLATGPH
ncbi:MAG: M23 family metallopeptidase, partial [Candidatus Desulforudis sp.]|nr:M23 family metallopeptidase [Desulforudis sp.]